jgi:glyoxylase-like metal-dependent hydrolase (beta-lactamase superfamily II)
MNTISNTDSTRLCGAPRRIARPLWLLSTALLVAPTVGLAAQYNLANANYDGDIHPRHIQGNVWLLAGEPDMSNVVVQVGDGGALVVDTGTGAMASKLLAQIQRLVQAQHGDIGAIRVVIDTDGAPDHIGGNQVIREGGTSIQGGNAEFDNPGVAKGARVWARQEVAARMVAEHVGEALWPSQNDNFEIYNMHFNGEAVQLYHMDRSTSDGNVAVQFRRSDVIAAGDVLSSLSYPRIDVASGGTIDGELVALNRLMNFAVPNSDTGEEGGQEGGTLVVPGHGRLCDQADINIYRNMVTVVRNRVQFYKNQGKSLAEVLALKPTADYDGRWGADSGAWTTRQFIEAVYRTVPAKSGEFSMQEQWVVPAGKGAGGEVF